MLFMGVTLNADLSSSYLIINKDSTLRLVPELKEFIYRTQMIIIKIRMAPIWQSLKFLKLAFLNL